MTATAPGSPIGAPERPWWKQPAVYVVLVVIGLVVAAVLLAAAQISGTTSAQDISAGRCYEEPSGEFTRLEEQDCAGTHDLEVIMMITMPSGPFPTSDQFEAEVNEVCGPEFSTVDWDGLPADTDGGWFEPNRAGWDQGDHEVACYLYSSTGLVGPVPRR